MKKMFGRCFYILPAFATTVLVLMSVAFQTPSMALASTATSSLSGWAWSDNTGWLSFNSTDSGAGGSLYGVILATSTGSSIGTLSGDGWSPNIGWVSFNSSDVTNCPSDLGATLINGCVPSVNVTTGAVSGWARALAGTNSTGLVVASSTVPAWDPETQLYEQFIAVTNNTGQNLSGARLTMTSALPSGVSVFGSSGGTDANGNIYFQDNYPLSAGQTVYFGIDFYDPTNTSFNPNYTLQAMATTLSEPTIPSGSTQVSVSATYYASDPVSTYVNYSGPITVLQWTSISGDQYGLQYSDDGGVTWHTAYGLNSTAVLDTAGSSATILLDFGLPATDAAPISTRQYKMWQLPSGSYPARNLNWTTQAAGNHSWFGITSSADGSKLAAVDNNTGYVYTSPDSGVTWTAQTAAGARLWSGITSSSDGTKIAAVAQTGIVYTSADSGVTWTAHTVSGATSLYKITSSSDGTKIVAVDTLSTGGYIYTSADSGVTWTARTAAGSRSWIAVTSSSDGTKLLASDRAGGSLYTSSDSGATWTTHTLAGAWWSLSSSADGTKLVAAATPSGSYLYTSADSGVTWTARIAATGAYGWGSVTSSSDGTKIVAGNAGPNAYIYTSADSGVTWAAQIQSTSTSRMWMVTSSADGSKIAAGDFYGTIHTATSVSTTTTANSNSGWDGWIELSGTNHASPDLTGNSGVTYNSTTGSFTGYAWGSDIIGWLNFNSSGASASSSCNPTLEVCNGPGSSPTLSCSGSLNGSTNKITWTATITGGASPYTFAWTPGSGTSGTPSTVGAVSTYTTGTLASTSPATSYSVTVAATSSNQTVAISNACPSVQGPLQSSPPSGGLCTSVPPNATLCPGSSAATGSSSLVSTCTAAAGTPICQYSCSSNYHQVGSQCVGNGSLQEQ